MSLLAYGDYVTNIGVITNLNAQGCFFSSYISYQPYLIDYSIGLAHAQLNF